MLHAYVHFCHALLDLCWAVRPLCTNRNKDFIELFIAIVLSSSLDTATSCLYMYVYQAYPLAKSADLLSVRVLAGRSAQPEANAAEVRQTDFKYIYGSKNGGLKCIGAI
jgi:hypothetical protein